MALPTTSPWAEKYHCAARIEEPDVVDTQAGYVTATDQTRGPSWGRFARPGTAKVYVFPKCDGGRVVADINRIDKGHTEGYEPHITEKLVQLMVAAPVLKGPHATVKTASAKPAKKCAAGRGRRATSARLHSAERWATHWPKVSGPAWDCLATHAG